MSELKYFFFAPCELKIRTLKNNTIIIVATPKTESHSLISLIFTKKDFQASRNSLAGPGIPSKDLVCELAILIAAAVVKPDITGNEKKSTKNPRIHHILLKIKI